MSSINIETASIPEIIEYLRENRIYLDIESRMMGTTVTRTYRIYQQEEKHYDYKFEDAVRSAARKAQADIQGVDDYWDAMGEFIQLVGGSTGLTRLFKEVFGDGVREQLNRAEKKDV